jgi:hypothetical protein
MFVPATTDSFMATVSTSESCSSALVVAIRNFPTLPPDKKCVEYKQFCCQRKVDGVQLCAVEEDELRSAKHLIRNMSAEEIT